MFQSTLIFYFIFFITLSALCQTDKVYNIVQLDTSQNYQSDNFADLLPLEKILSDSIKIILLGEQSHGEGTTNLAKTRLIRFLHEKMGFEILAFENPMYDMWQAENNIKNGINCDNSLRTSIIQNWSGCDQFKNLISYICATNMTNSPLTVCGFDSQFYSYFQYIGMAPQITSFLRDLSPEFEKNDSEFQNFIEIIKKCNLDYKFKPTEDEKNKFDIFCDKLIQDINNSSHDSDFSSSKLSFMTQLIKSIKAQINVVFKNDTEHFTTGDKNAYLRDKQMAENLIWLEKTYYKNKKIIVWAANYHCTRNPQLLKYQNSDYRFPENSRMGDYLYKEFGKKMYFLLSTCYDGETSDGMQRTKVSIQAATTGSFEYFMHSKGFASGIIDFNSLDKTEINRIKNSTLRESYFMEFKADWTQVADGILYIDRIVPCKQ